MKQIVSNYSYSPATNVVTLTGLNVDADQLLLIVAPQVGRTMYNFASVTGVVSAGADTRITLNASTAGLTTTSPLVIFYDDQASTQTISGTVTAGNLPIVNYDEPVESGQAVAVKIASYGQQNVPISGTVTANGLALGQPIANVFPLGIGSVAGGVRAVADYIGYYVPVAVREIVDVAGTVTVGNSVTIGAMPNGALTTRFGSVTTANTAFASSCVTNANRKYLLIQNVTTGSNVITVGIGFTPTTTQGIQLAVGAGITFESSYIPTGAVYVLSSVTASNFTILEA